MKRILLCCTMMFLLISCENMKTCPVCGGRGNIMVSGVGMPCSGCQGEGEVPVTKYEAIKSIWIKFRGRQFVNSNCEKKQQERQVHRSMCSGSGVVDGNYLTSENSNNNYAILGDKYYEADGNVTKNKVLAMKYYMMTEEYAMLNRHRALLVLDYHKRSGNVQLSNDDIKRLEIIV